MSLFSKIGDKLGKDKDKEKESNKEKEKPKEGGQDQPDAGGAGGTGGTDKKGKWWKLDRKKAKQEAVLQPAVAGEGTGAVAGATAPGRVAGKSCAQGQRMPRAITISLSPYSLVLHYPIFDSLLCF